MKKRSKLAKILIPASLLFAAMFFSQNASAAVCSPNIAGKITKSANTSLNSDLDRLKNREQQINNAEEAIDNSIFGCTDIWPTGDFGFKLPNISDIITKMGEEAMNKACKLARDKVREQTDKINQSVSLDTSMIDGFDELGLGRYELGSAKASGGTGNSSDISIKDNSRKSSGSNWDSISNAINSFN